MITKLPKSEQNIIGVTASGKLTKKDYDWFSPYLHETVDKYRHISLLVEMDDFHGWEVGAAWEDLKLYGLDFNKKIDKIALVGDQKWEKWMAAIGKPFVFADMQYFDKSEVGSAWDWVEKTPE